MAQPPETGTTYEVKCPHCNKQFQAEPKTGAAARFTGFKCPHCRLFVPYQRVEEQDRLQTID
jgi:hypothetical protein